MAGSVGFYSAMIRFEGGEPERMLFSEGDVEGTACDDMVFFTAPRREALLASAGSRMHSLGDFEVLAVGEAIEADPDYYGSVLDAAVVSEFGKASVTKRYYDSDRLVDDGLGSDVKVEAHAVDSWEQPVTNSMRYLEFLETNSDGFACMPSIEISNGRWQMLADVCGSDGQLIWKGQRISMVHESGAEVVLDEAASREGDVLEYVRPLVEKTLPELWRLSPDVLGSCAAHDVPIDASYLEELAMGERSVEMAAGADRARLGLNPQWRQGPGDGMVTDKQLERMSGMADDSPMMADAHALASVGGITRNEATLFIEGARRGLDGPAEHVNVYGKMDLHLVGGKVYDYAKEAPPVTLLPVVELPPEEASGDLDFGSDDGERGVVLDRLLADAELDADAVGAAMVRYDEMAAWREANDGRPDPLFDEDGLSLVSDADAMRDAALACDALADDIVVLPGGWSVQWRPESETGLPTGYVLEEPVRGEPVRTIGERSAEMARIGGMMRSGEVECEWRDTSFYINREAVRESLSSDGASSKEAFASHDGVMSSSVVDAYDADMDVRRSQPAGAVSYEAFGQSYALMPSVAFYQTSPGNVAVSLTDVSDGAPFAVATVNTDVEMKPWHAAIDENNVPGIGQALQEAGLAHPYRGLTVPSGFCDYPIYEFDAEALRRFDPVGCSLYEESLEKLAAKDVPSRDAKLERACAALGLDPASVQDGDEYDVVRDAKGAMMEDDWDFDY